MGLRRLLHSGGARSDLERTKGVIGTDTHYLDRNDGYLGWLTFKDAKNI